jgi:hypothetical protein
MISFTLHVNVRKVGFDHEAHYFHYHAFVWGCTTFLTLIPAFAGAYSSTNAYCRFASDFKSNLARILVVYFPLILAFIYISYVSWIIHKHIIAMKNSQDQEARDSIESLKRFRNYPLALIICYSFGLVNRLLTAGGHSTVVPLVFLHILLSSLQGLLNAVIYGMTPAVREKLGKLSTPIAVRFRRLSNSNVASPN